MVLGSITHIRTGIVSNRKRSRSKTQYNYKILNLKCLNSDGFWDFSYSEDFSATEEVNKDFLTKKSDIIIRLSYPYTVAMITDDEACGYLVPSHFAIVRVTSKDFLPEYVLWFLKRKSIYQKILKNTSGTSAFGTISSTFFGELKIKALPINKQMAIGQICVLSDKEQLLLNKLAYEKKQYNRLIAKKIYDDSKRSN